MTIHTALLGQFMSRIAKQDPYVLCGDMNFKPDSLCYDLMVKGQTDTAHPEHAAGFPAKPHSDDTDFELTTAPLRSAYKEALGAEPQFTNNAQVKQMEPFVECLDYIFVSPQWKVKGVLPLQAKSTLTHVFPDEKEPSDHVVIAADLQL